MAASSCVWAYLTAPFTSTQTTICDDFIQNMHVYIYSYPDGAKFSDRK